MKMRLVENLEVINLNDISFEDIYSQKENVYISFYQDCLYIKDLTNAMKRGKEVNVYSIYNNIDRYTKHFKADFSHYLSEAELSIGEFVKRLLEGNLEASELIEIRTRQDESNRVFNPFFEPKRITEPKKWTLSHITKGILTGQIISGECTMHLTDDYAYDNQINFGKGRIDLIELCKDIVESPSGWWISTDKKIKDGFKVLGVNCHHFNYNTVCFNPEGTRELDIEHKEEIIYCDKVIDLTKYRLNKAV